MNTLLILGIAHVIGDYLLQWNKLAKDKEDGKKSALWLHILLYAVTMGLVFLCAPWQLALLSAGQGRQAMEQSPGTGDLLLCGPGAASAHNRCLLGVSSAGTADGLDLGARGPVLVPACPAAHGPALRDLAANGNFGSQGPCHAPATGGTEEKSGGILC